MHVATKAHVLLERHARILTWMHNNKTNVTCDFMTKHQLANETSTMRCVRARGLHSLVGYFSFRPHDI